MSKRIIMMHSTVTNTSWLSRSSNITHVMTDSLSHERRIYMWHDSQYNICIESCIIHLYLTWLTIRVVIQPLGLPEGRRQWLTRCVMIDSFIRDMTHHSRVTWLTIRMRHDSQYRRVIIQTSRLTRRSSTMTHPLSFDWLLHMWHASQSIRDMTPPIHPWHDNHFICDMTQNSYTTWLTIPKSHHPTARAPRGHGLFSCLSLP